MKRGCFKVWPALAFSLACLGAPLHAQFAYVANGGSNNVLAYTIAVPPDPIAPGTLTALGTFAGRARPSPAPPSRRGG
jgi:hypothetical protein